MWRGGVACRGARGSTCPGYCRSKMKLKKFLGRNRGLLSWEKGERTPISLFVDRRTGSRSARRRVRDRVGSPFRPCGARQRERVTILGQPGRQKDSRKGLWGLVFARNHGLRDAAWRPGCRSRGTGEDTGDVGSWPPDSSLIRAPKGAHIVPPSPPTGRKRPVCGGKLPGSRPSDYRPPCRPPRR